MSEPIAYSTKRKPSRFACWAVLLLSGTLFGSSFSIMKVAVDDGAHPLGLTFWFAIISAAFVSIAAGLRGSFRHLTLEVLRFCLVWGLLGTVIPGALFFYAATKIPAGIIALAIAMVPIFTYLGALLLRQDEPTFRRVVGITIGALAGALLLLPAASLPEPGDTFWVLLTFLAAMCFAIEHLFFARKVPKTAPLDLLLSIMFLSAAILLLPLVVMTSSFVVPAWPLQSAEIAVAAVALVTTADYLFFALLIAWAGPVFTSQAAYVVTISGVLWGVVLFDEQHSPWIWASLVLLMIGIYLVQPRSSRRET